jgi:hypothetical protein
MNSGVNPGACVFRTSGGAGDTNGVAVSGVATVRSDPTNINRILIAGYQLFWTGTLAGTFTVQVSNKLNPDPATDSDWSDIALDKAIVQPAGSASKDYVDLSLLPFVWMRLKYVNASGSGNIFAFVGGA